MINKQKIKKLALIAAENSKVPKDIEKFVLTKMSKQELKDFLRFLRIELDKRRVYVMSSEKLLPDNITIIKRLFGDKEIIETIDKSVGAGLKIRNNDLVIDFTFKNFINDTIEKIKN